MPGARPVRSAASMYARGLLAAVVLLIAADRSAGRDHRQLLQPLWVAGAPSSGILERGRTKAGFGWEKIRGKHQISNMGVVRQMVHAPGRIYENPPGSNRWIHEHIARRFRCGFGCVEVEQVTVKLVVDYNDFHGRGPIGIITLY